MKGVFALCIEVELAWGRVHKRKIDLPKAKRVSINTRMLLDAVIHLLEKYRIPATWSIVGHLLLDYCRRSNKDELPHPEMPRPSYSWSKGDWYKYDPCTTIQDDPAWYGKDIVDKIVQYVKKGKTTDDIGCHSFSHQMFGDQGCSAELARAEIKKCIELMEMQYGIAPQIFTFPRDYVGNINVLRELGFQAFRDIPPKLYPCLQLERTISNYIKTYFSLFAQLLSYYLLFPPHAVTPREAIPGLWAVPGSLAYGKKQLIPLWLVTFKAKQGIRKAVKEGKVFLMYTHLRNFGEDKHMLSNFENLLLYVSKKRDEGKLEVMTMTELVERSRHIL